MAIQNECIVRCASGRVAQFIKSGATSGAIEEMVTGGEDVNQVAGISFGQALAGEVVTHAYITVASPSTGAGFDVGFVTTPQGNVGCIFQGGTGTSALPQLYRPLKVETGMLLKAQATTAATTVVEVTFAAWFNDGSCSVFQATGSDGAKADFSDVISSATWGQTGSGKLAVAYYCTNQNSNGLTEGNSTGNSFAYALDAQGQLKGLIAPQLSGGVSAQVEYSTVPIMVDQNDTLSVSYKT